MKVRLALSFALLFLCSTVLVSAQDTDWQSYLNYARQLNNQNQFTQALPYAEQAVKLNRSSWEARYEAARSYIGLGRNQEAGVHFQAALPSAPSQYKAYMEKFLAGLGNSVPSASSVGRDIKIFQDQMTHGTDIRVMSGAGSTQRSKVTVDAGQFHSGTRSLFFDIDTEIDTQCYISFTGTWRAQNVPRPGDLSRYRDRGALEFWIKGKKSGAGYELGFWTDTGQAAGRTLFSVLPLQKYCFVTQSWQKVIIPLSDFYNAYVVDVIPSGEKGGLRKYRRRETKMIWSDVKGVLFSSTRTKVGEASFWIDDLVLVSSYQKNEMEGLKATAKKNEAGKRQADPLIIFDDSTEQTFWSNPPDTAFVSFDEMIFHQGKRGVKVSLDINAEGHSSAGTQFSELDLSSIRGRGALQYWARGNRGGEHWSNSLRCKIQGRDVWSRGPDVRSITDITKKWRKVRVSLSDFRMIAEDVANNSKPDKFDWKRVDMLSWWVVPAMESEMVFFLDDIRFTPK